MSKEISQKSVKEFKTFRRLWQGTNERNWKKLFEQAALPNSLPLIGAETSFSKFTLKTTTWPVPSENIRNLSVLLIIRGKIFFSGAKNLEYGKSNIFLSLCLKIRYTRQLDDEKYRLEEMKSRDLTGTGKERYHSEVTF